MVQIIAQWLLQGEPSVRINKATSRARPLLVDVVTSEEVVLYPEDLVDRTDGVNLLLHGQLVFWKLQCRCLEDGANPAKRKRAIAICEVISNRLRLEQAPKTHRGHEAAKHGSGA